MNIKVVSVLVFVIFLSGMFMPVCFAADSCGVTKTDIIKSIIAHITQKSDISRGQVMVLITAYLGSADCGSNDVRQAKEKADSIDNNVIPRCPDGTLFAHCSVKDRPKYCYSGRLVDRCDLCCESGRCGSDGKCEGSEDADAACTRSDKPRCCAIGSRSEGWYQNGKLIKWDNCDGCYAVCKAVGSRSEGWYSSCDDKLIKYEGCRISCRDENYPCSIEDIPCCSGLKSSALFGDPNGDCSEMAKCGTICIPCGNGICDANEGICNCPQDCESSIPACTDTDKGENIYEKGTACRPSSVASTTGDSNLFCRTDECVSSTSLNEYYCKGDAMMSKTIACANGCADGACKRDLNSIAGWDPGLTKKLVAGIYPDNANYFELCPDGSNGKCYGEIPAGKGFYTIANDELCKINSGNNFYASEYNKNVPCPFEFNWKEDNDDVVANLKIDTTDFTSPITPNIYLGIQENVPYGDLYLGVDKIADINEIYKAHLKLKASYCFGPATNQLDIDSYRRARFFYHIVWYNPIKEKSYGVSINLLDFRQHLDDGSNIGADNYLLYETDKADNWVVHLGGKAWGIIPQDYQPTLDLSGNCSFENQESDPWIEVSIPISDILKKLVDEKYLSQNDINGITTCLIIGGTELWGRLSTSMEAKDHYITVKQVEECNPDNTDSTGKCSTDCGASAGCDGKAPNSCSTNSLKKCSFDCQEVSSCGDGTCNCGETQDNCSADCLNHLPIGYLDSATQSQVSGWAYDENTGTDPIDVHIYIDGKYIGSAKANQSRPDLVAAGATPDPNHGFTFSTPTDLSVGEHTAKVYAINYPKEPNPPLIGSPMTFTVEYIA